MIAKSITLDTEKLVEIGDNVQATVLEGNLLVLVVDLNQPVKPSKSGQMDMVASTGGLTRLGRGNWKIGLNVGKKA